MKIRNLLLTIAILLAASSCKSTIEQPIEEGLISLSSGATIASRVANEGIRTVFESGDQIGVIAVFGTVPAEGSSDPVLADWAKAAHFENIPAAFVSSANSVTAFNWGLNAEGGKTNNQYYPAAKKNIFLYSYYPYTVESGVYVPINIDGTTDDERQPKLNVELKHGAIDGSEADVLKKQPDVLYYAPTTAVSSASITGPFAFNHALAQIRFTVKRLAGSNPCTFKSLVFKSAAKGTLNLSSGVFTYDPAVDFKEAVYTVKIPTTGDAVADSLACVIPDPDPNTSDVRILDILNPAGETNFNYLMVLPLSQVDAEKGELVLTCNFGSQSDPTKEDITDFKIPLDGRLKPFEAGKLNTLAITVSHFGISVSASITPWGVGEVVELPAE